MQTSSGTMFVAPAASTRPIDSTHSSPLRAIRRVSSSAPAATGSLSWARMAPWPPVPWRRKRSSSLAAMYCPARKPSVPTSSWGSTCSPITAAMS